MALGARGIIWLLLVGAFVTMALDDGAPQVSPASAHGDVTGLASAHGDVTGLASAHGDVTRLASVHRPVTRAPSAQADLASVAPAYAKPRHDGPVSAGGGLGGRRACPLAVGTAGYVNPLARAKVKPERIDQGVDYAGSGPLLSIGTARVTHVATDDTGWPGAFIEYLLLDGPDAGCHVFYAEGVTPEPGLRVGDTLLAGQPVATIIPLYESGIEIGWGAGVGTTTYAAATDRWSADDDQNNVASRAGKNFSALVAALGGPPGKVEG